MVSEYIQIAASFMIKNNRKQIKHNNLSGILLCRLWTEIRIFYFFELHLLKCKFNYVPEYSDFDRSKDKLSAFVL